jgi:hypothetical protein
MFLNYAADIIILPLRFDQKRITDIVGTIHETARSRVLSLPNCRRTSINTRAAYAYLLPHPRWGINPKLPVEHTPYNTENKREWLPTAPCGNVTPPCGKAILPLVPIFVLAFLNCNSLACRYNGFHRELVHHSVHCGLNAVTPSLPSASLCQLFKETSRLEPFWRHVFTQTHDHSVSSPTIHNIPHHEHHRIPTSGHRADSTLPSI